MQEQTEGQATIEHYTWMGEHWYRKSEVDARMDALRAVADAAPELLTACKAVVIACGDSSNWQGETNAFLRLCEAAIQKAETCNIQHLTQKDAMIDKLVAACRVAEHEMTEVYRLGLVDSLAPKSERSSFTEAVSSLRAALAALDNGKVGLSHVE